MIWFKKLTALEIFGIISTIIGLTGVAVFREPLIHLLGGFTEAEMSGTFAKRVSNDPNFEIRFIKNIEFQECADSLEQALERAETTLLRPWKPSTKEDHQRSGYNFSFEEENGYFARGDIACFSREISASAGDKMVYMVATLNSPDQDFIKGEKLLENIIKLAFDHFDQPAQIGIPSPFMPKLDKYGQLVVPNTYLDKKIVIQSN